jgi:hypothetical protein
LGKKRVKQDLSLKTFIVSNSKNILKMNYNPTCVTTGHAMLYDLKRKKIYAMMQVAKKSFNAKVLSFVSVDVRLGLGTKGS